MKPEDVTLFVDAYLAGIRASLVLGGAAAILAGAAAWLLLGRRDPLVTIWEHRDERDEGAGAAIPAPAID